MMSLSVREEEGSGLRGEGRRAWRGVAGDAHARCPVSVRIYGIECGLVLAGARGCVGCTSDGNDTPLRPKLEAEGTRVVIAKKPAVIAACEWMEAAGVPQCGSMRRIRRWGALETMRKLCRRRHGEDVWSRWDR